LLIDDAQAQQQRYIARITTWHRVQTATFFRHVLTTLQE
jgi:hypothetical protein